MADDSGQDKSEEATPKRRLDALQKGQAPKSMELNSVAVMIIGFVFLYYYGKVIYKGSMDLIRYWIDWAGELKEMDIGWAVFGTHGMMMVFMQMLTPLFIALMVGSILISVVQVGWHPSAEGLKPNFSRLNPIEGMKQKFSKRLLVEMVKSIFKLGVVSLLAYIVIKKDIDELFNMMTLPVAVVPVLLGWMLFKLALYIVLLFIFLALGDFIYQKYEFAQNIKMTKQEVKDEWKQTEGDPLIRAKIREKMRELARAKMMGDVPKADVIITNPTHIAIALKYDKLTMSAPQVLAKGIRKTAERIIEIAKENDVPIFRDPPLAQEIYKMVEVGQFIPEDLFTAVANVLAYIYKQGKRGNLVNQFS